MEQETLLPPNRTKFEEAADLTGARSGSLPVDLPVLVRPYAIPTTFLPWLAWGLSVDLWDVSWPEDKRRNIVAGSLPLHAKKGTPYAIKTAVGIVGATLKRFTVPPAKTFLDPAYTTEERRAYLSRFAQLRIYPYVARATYRFANFTTAAFGRPKAYLNACMVKDNGAWSRWVRTAAMWDKDVSTTLTIRAVKGETVGRFYAADYDEVVLAPKPTAAIHLNTPPKAASYLIDDQGVAQRLVRIPRDASYTYRLGRETYTTLYPDGDPIEIAPEDVAEGHDGQAGALYGSARQFIAGHYLPPTISWRYLFERWFLHDPDRVPEERKRATHLAFTRLGMTPYHAEARTKIVGRSVPRAVGPYVNGYFVSSDQKMIADVRNAVRITKSLRDKVLIDTKNYRRPRPGDRFKLGEITLGQFIEV